MLVTLNAEARRRLSTYANIITLVCGAVMAYFPTIGLDQQTTGIVMTCCAVMTALAQAVTIKPKESGNALVDDNQS